MSITASRYTSPNVSIVSGEGCMYNEATTSINNHVANSRSINHNTNDVVTGQFRRVHYGKAKKGKKSKK